MREKAVVTKTVDPVPGLLSLAQEPRTMAPWGLRRRVASCGRFMLAGLLSASAAAASTPVGWLGTVNAGNNRRILGWALDMAAPSSSINVHIYFDLGTP
jgi:hypothetical protein